MGWSIFHFLLSPRSRQSYIGYPIYVQHVGPRSSCFRTMNTQSTSAGHQVLSLYVIYDADSTLTGEILYFAKKALGIGHCAACDITHGPRGEKPEFSALKSTYGWTIPLLNIHRDQMDETMRACVRRVLPAVVARTDTGDCLLVNPHELAECAGSVDGFIYVVEQRAEQMGLVLNRAPFASPCVERSPSKSFLTLHQATDHTLSVPTDGDDDDDDDDALVPYPPAR